MESGSLCASRLYSVAGLFTHYEALHSDFVKGQDGVELMNTMYDLIKDLGLDNKLCVQNYHCRNILLPVLLARKYIN
jgi:hypothetical protein